MRILCAEDTRSPDRAVMNGLVARQPTGSSRVTDNTEATVCYPKCPGYPGTMLADPIWDLGALCSTKPVHSKDVGSHTARGVVKSAGTIPPACIARYR